MDTSEILSKILEYSHLNIKAFSELIGLERPQAIYDIQKGKTKRISQSMMIKIISVFPEINKSWILTGDGEMLNNEYQKSQNEIKPKRDKEHIIKYYDIEASAGGILMYNDNREKHRDIVIPGFQDCDIALNVWGDSMEPVLKSGEIAAMREWQEPFIDWGKIYLVVTKTGYRMIKYLKKGDHEDEVICESANPAHDPFTIKKYDIAKLYQIKGCISRYSI